MAKVIIFLLLVVPAVVFAIPTSKCDSDNEPISVKIDRCNDQYCEVKRDQPSKMELTFKLAADANALVAEAQAQLDGKWVKFDLGKQSNVCDNLSNGKKCPLKAGDEAIYAPMISIPKTAPIGTKLLVQLRIVDGNKKGIVCTRIPVLVSA